MTIDQGAVEPTWVASLVVPDDYRECKPKVNLAAR
jgi:hypothetical protein